jgi:hypothetical protein
VVALAPLVISRVGAGGRLCAPLPLRFNDQRLATSRGTRREIIAEAFPLTGVRRNSRDRQGMFSFSPHSSLAAAEADSVRSRRLCRKR